MTTLEEFVKISTRHYTPRQRELRETYRNVTRNGAQITPEQAAHLKRTAYSRRAGKSQVTMGENVSTGNRLQGLQEAEEKATHVGIGQRVQNFFTNKKNALTEFISNKTNSVASAFHVGSGSPPKGDRRGWIGNIVDSVKDKRDTIINRGKFKYLKSRGGLKSPTMPTAGPNLSNNAMLNHNFNPEAPNLGPNLSNNAMLNHNFNPSMPTAGPDLSREAMLNHNFNPSMPKAGQDVREFVSEYNQSKGKSTPPNTGASNPQEAPTPESSNTPKESGNTLMNFVKDHKGLAIAGGLTSMGGLGAYMYNKYNNQEKEALNPYNDRW